MPVPSVPLTDRPIGLAHRRSAWNCGWIMAIGCGLAAISLPSTAAAKAKPSPVQASWDDPTMTPDQRANRALEAANHLDELARQAKNGAESRARWLEAAQLLDQCVARDPEAAVAASLRFQAAVYLWARARASLDGVELVAASDPERLDVARGLDDVIGRLRGILPKSGAPTDPFAQNLRFRLAQAIADRARLRPESDPERVGAEKEAQGLLDRSITSPRLRAFARLLHADLANRLGQFGPAQIEAEEAAKLDLPPPILATTETRITALAGRGLFAEAVEVINRSPVAAEQKTLWQLRLALARRRVAQPGQAPTAATTEAFELAGKLRGGQSPEAHRGLMELARAIDNPGPNGLPGWWDLLVEGRLLLLEPAQAAALAGRGADRAVATHNDQAAPLRFKAGACWFQAEKFSAADASLTQVVTDQHAPGSLRAKAGMLRAISRGRALATRQPGASPAAYLTALEDQVRNFPDDPSSGEARWLLGKLRLAANRTDDAIALWSQIRHEHPRWLEAESGAADLAINAIQDQWISHDSAAVRPKVESARALIRAALDRANEGDEVVPLGLRLARLELIPGVGQPAEAIAILDRLLRGPGSDDQHRQARLGRMVALAEQNRFADAEVVARTEAKSDDFGPLLPAIRQLDQAASSTEGDLIRKRTGSLIRTLLDRWVEPIDRTPAPARDEVRLRHARALIFLGDTAAARRAIARWGGPSDGSHDAEFLQDLGDTYFRLEAYPLAVDVERLRASKLSTGTAAWFDARYSLALALFRSNRRIEARKIIDATTILHPDLGGGETRAKFERLGQKIGADPG